MTPQTVLKCSIFHTRNILIYVIIIKLIIRHFLIIIELLITNNYTRIIFIFLFFLNNIPTTCWQQFFTLHISPFFFLIHNMISVSHYLTNVV